MRKFIIFSILFLLVKISFSQEIFSTDSDFTVYDLYYLQNNVQSQQEVIKLLNKKIVYYQSKVDNVDNYLSTLNYKLGLYKKIYADLLRVLYIFKSSFNSTFLFIFSAESFNKASLRYYYMKMLVSYLKEVTQYIHLIEKEYETNSELLKNYKKALEYYLENYQNNRQSLDSNVVLLMRQTEKMKQNLEKIRITINQTNANFKLIKSSIEEATNTSDNVENIKFENLQSPLKNAVIISSFGEHSHNSLQNIKIRNDGIDLYSRTDTLVKAVLPGTVQVILDVPNYGHSIIIKHGEYFTVYSNLSMIYVDVNDKVFKGQIIASISKKYSKYSFACLNFQVWHNVTKLDPAKFLNL